MSTPFETPPASTPRKASEPRLDDRAFLAVLAAMLLMLLATVGGLAEPADAAGEPTALVELSRALVAATLN